MIFTEKRTVGLDIGSNVIKVIGIRRKRSKIQVEFINAIDLYQSQKISRPENLSDTLLVQVVRELIHGLKGGVRKVTTSISSSNSLTRIIKLPILRSDELRSAIKWELASIIPFDIENIEFDFQVLNIDKNNNVQTIIVGLVPVSELKKHLEILSRANLEPETVDIDAIAIYNCFISFMKLQSEKTIAILNIGAERTILIIYHPLHIPFFTSIAIGGNILTRAIERQYHTSFPAAEHQKIEVANQQADNGCVEEQGEKLDWQSLLIEMVRKLAEELNRANIYYQILYDVAGIDQIFLTGGGAKMKHLDYLLAEMIKISVAVWNPLKTDELEINCKNNNLEELGLHFTTALGLALKDKA
ncbi:MAG: type IV pilus assembly protein PilM [Bacteroidetes bacterium]|nr:type IV pilus assembly protein PilM [Bacteroidota bacterium]MBL7067214.1 type IV pilus assembly protein PilM [Candidatus Neomarinimicrobiota bacterium]